MDLFIGLVALFYFLLLLIKNFFYLNKFLFIIIIFLSLFLTLLLSHVADRVLVLWPGVRPELLRWES